MEFDDKTKTQSKITTFKKATENAKKEIERILGVSYEEYEKMSFEEQRKLRRKKTGKDCIADHRQYIDGIPMDEEHIIKMDEVDSYFNNYPKKILKKQK